MDNSAPDDFDFDRMIRFLNMKSKIVAPASNPRIALTTKNKDFYPGLYQTGGGAVSNLPSLRPNQAMMHQTNRSMIRS